MNLITRLKELRERKATIRPPPATIHIAIICPDAKTARAIKNHVTVITPTTWPGTVRLHVIIDDGKNPIPVELRILLADLQIVDHAELGMAHIDEVEIGWKEER